MASNEQPPKAGDRVVKTRFSGTLVSFESEGAKHVEGEVRYSRKVMAALFRWRDATPVKLVSAGEYQESVAAFAKEAKHRFGLTSDFAQEIAESRVKIR